MVRHEVNLLLSKFRLGRLNLDEAISETNESCRVFFSNMIAMLWLEKMFTTFLQDTAGKKVPLRCIYFIQGSPILHL